jgi:hypothetical protein
MMKHEAIYALYPSVVTIIDKGSDVIPKDAKGDVVSINNSTVSTKQTELLEARNLAELREKRNKLLTETDFYALSDVTMTDNMKTYRQNLRDITKTYKSITDNGFAFPTKPTD